MVNSMMAQVELEPQNASARDLDPTDAALSAIEERFLDFAAARAIGADRDAAIRSGAFSALPDRSAPDLFGAVDMAYAFHILRRLDEVTDDAGRAEWIDFIVAHQSDDGWFRAGDKQRHSVEHATAYALGALQILSGGRAELLAGKLRPFTALRNELNPMPDERTAPFSLRPLDRVHFWRGSHRAGGLPAIVGATHELGLAGELLPDLSDPSAWLDGWWSYFAARVTPKSGFWRLAPSPLQKGFDTLYKRRHDPQLASMGGAVHLYWVAWRLGRPFPHPAEMVDATRVLMQPSGLYEHEPYCIDLDGNFLIARSLRQLPREHSVQDRGRAALATNRGAVVDWFVTRDPKDWNANSHKLPGAFAAIAEADTILDPAPRWRDVFEATWWL